MSRSKSQSPSLSVRFRHRHRHRRLPRVALHRLRSSSNNNNKIKHQHHPTTMMRARAPVMMLNNNNQTKRKKNKESIMSNIWMKFYDDQAYVHIPITVIIIMPMLITRIILILLMITTTAIRWHWKISTQIIMHRYYRHVNVVDYVCYDDVEKWLRPTKNSKSNNSYNKNRRCNNIHYSKRHLYIQQGKDLILSIVNINICLTIIITNTFVILNTHITTHTNKRKKNTSSI